MSHPAGRGEPGTSSDAHTEPEDPSDDSSAGSSDEPLDSRQPSPPAQETLGAEDLRDESGTHDGRVTGPGRRRSRWDLRRIVVDTRPLSIPAYRRLWTSTIVTSVGSQLTAVAVPKQIYDITGSSAYVGLAGLVALVPLVVFALWGGAIADAVDRRKLLLVTNTGIAVTSLLFWAQAFAGAHSVWVLFGLLGLQQACAGVNQPARSASIPRLVPARLLPAANALGSTVFQIGSIIGPLLAGVLIPILGLSTLYLIDSVALTVTIWAVWRLPALPPMAGAPRRAGLRHVIEGFGYLATRKVLLVSFLADVIAMVFGMPRALFPQMAQQTFGDPAGGGFALGILFAAIPVGAVLGGLFSGAFSRIRRHGVAVIAAVCAWGLAIVGFGLSPWLWLAAFFLALAGMADLVSMVFRGTIMQSAATDEMRGRMQGVFTVVVAGGPRLADLLHGTAGAAVGTSLAVSGGGVLVVVAMLAAVVAFPIFWRYRAAQDS
ncbi:Predicted arabinose efflux permease, MFS family [Actinopolymorpha cephalotaxi]|uniref:MFS family permease n=1 Tax=Actinopolymorpha cephalotaxi TaxID=504797 RepID=A0A1I2KH22_9ACTN|nr:MFS transporter [Actinopolymorpha cephalotaxi]NYH81172.1 MFS family permease [Actinopolymorpha cephalotaxi]SFF65530.1 Predicted arabinose efflux permease, MFS family [Actinopolymorpha cephalotaxi]